MLDACAVGTCVQCICFSHCPKDLALLHHSIYLSHKLDLWVHSCSCYMQKSICNSLNSLLCCT